MILSLSARSEETIVEGPRPVAKAVAHLNSEYGIAVTYEDPRYVYREDVKDITAEQGRPLTAGSRRSVIPLGGRVTLPGTEDLRQDPSTARAFLASVLRDASLSPHLGRFELVESDKMLHVLPTEARDESGEWAPQHSVLDVTVDIPSGHRNGFTMLEEICSAVTRAAAERIVVGTAPINRLVRHEQHYPRMSGLARDVLIDTLQEIDTGLTWRIYYDPGFDMRALNVLQMRRSTEVNAEDRDEQRSLPPLGRSVASPRPTSKQQ